MYIEDVLVIQYNFNDNVHNISVYPNELEINDTTKGNIHASYLDILLSVDTDKLLTT